MWFGGQRRQDAGVAEAAADAFEQLRAQSLPDPQGQPVPLTRFDDRLRVVNFWATWCPPCVEEMPALSALQRELDAAGGQPPAQILGIGIDSAAKIAEFANKHEIAYPVLVAGAGGLDMLRSLGNDSGGLPFTLIIDAKGRIIDRVSGTIDIGRLRAQLRTLQRAS
ncbi:MAG: TlpA disulfide reductase family protein [Burkholderiaceae bacterium]